MSVVAGLLLVGLIGLLVFQALFASVRSSGPVPESEATASSGVQSRFTQSAPVWACSAWARPVSASKQDEQVRAPRAHYPILLSPIVVSGLGQLVARIAGPKLGLWAWGFLFLGYWATLGALIAGGGGKKAIIRWLQPSQGSRLWPLLAVAFAVLSTLWMFIPNHQLLLRPQVLLLTITFVLINPCLEEGYWRGLIIDAAACWPRWLANLYSSAFSAINHLWLMVVVTAARNPAVVAYQFVLGLLMGVVYLETRSLRWPIAAHALVNLLSLTVALFLNLYIPGPPT